MVIIVSSYFLRIQPAFDGGNFVLADDDFNGGEGGDVDAHLAEEIGGELADGSGANDELTVHTHETLRVELTLCLFQGHVQGMGIAVEGAQANYTVADGDVAHVAHRNNQVFVGTMGNQKAFAIADGLTLYGSQQLGDGIGR